MRTRVIVLLFVTAVLAWATASFTRAQSGSAQAQAIPRTHDGKPDFTGVWAGPAFTHQVGRNDTDTPAVIVYDPRKMPSLTAKGKQLMFRKVTGNAAYDNPTGVCLPAGLMLEITSPYAQQWIQAPNYLVIRYEYQNNASRVIPLDGRPHSKDIDPTWMGESVGKWEGDTLVIDTVGIKEWALDDKIHFPDANGEGDGSHWHSGSLHVIERLRYTGLRTASYQVTIDDPEYFTQPWTQEYNVVLHPTWNLLEFVCEENNRCREGKCTPANGQ
jgi:hypothetical protein